MTLFLGAVTLSLVAALQNPPPAPPAGTARISGLVTRSDTNQPLANATVRLVRWDGGLGQGIPSQRTGADGRFTFEGLRDGEYAATFSADAFVTLEFGQRRPLEGPRRIQLRAAEHFANADIALPPTTAIEGRLLDEFGDPAPGITVQVARVQFVAGTRRLTPVSGSSPTRPTDDLGQFRIFNLPPGDYYLLALAGPFAGPADPSGFAVTYFPGTRVPTEAKSVRLDVGRDTTGTVFQLVPAPLSTVSGVVTDATGTPIPCDVMLLPTTGGDVRSLLMGRLPVASDGIFSFRNVTPGTYVIQAYGRPVGGGNLGRSPFGYVELIVLDGNDLTNLKVTIPPGATARGRIIFEGDTPPAMERIRVFPSPINFVSAPVGGGPPNSVTNTDGTFEVSNMSGLRVMRVIVGSPQWALKKLTLNGKDITDEPIDFRDGDVSGLEVTLTTRSPTLAGSVTDGDKPASDFHVIVFSDDPARWVFPSRYFAQASPAPQGTFKIQGLLPAGSYYVVVLPALQGTDWQDPEFLQQQIGVATRVALEEGDTRTISLKLIRR